MGHPTSSTTTVALLGVGARKLPEDILVRLLERAGYSVRCLEAPPTGPVDGLLEGVDVLLLSPGASDGVREAFLKAMSTTPRTAAVPVLPISETLKQALLDELFAGTPWRDLFEELTSQIGESLSKAAQGAWTTQILRCSSCPP